MLKFFRRNLITNIVALFVFTLVLFVYYLLSKGNFVSQSLAIPFQDIHGIKIPFANYMIVQFITGVILIFAQAMMVSQFIIKHKMSRSLSLIPGAVMALYCAFVLQPSFNHTILIANFFFILSIGTLFKVYKVFNPIGNIFNSGFFLGLATFLYRPYFIYFIVLIMGLIVLRSLKFKEILQVILGFLCPLFLIGILMYYNNSLGVFQEYCNISVTIPSIDFSDIQKLIKPLIILVLILMLVFNQNALRKKKKFDAIKKIELNYWILIISLLTLLFVNPLEVSHLLILSLPMALLGGLIFESKENTTTKEFVFFALVALYVLLVVGVV